MIYELRIYRFHPGRKPTFLRHFKGPHLYGEVRRHFCHGLGERGT